MIRFLDSLELLEYPTLRRTMFLDRAYQFSERLNWKVTLNELGEEVDMYDQYSPVYVIAEGRSGRHLGSMRLMPTLGKTMTNDHFSSVSGGINFSSNSMWECSRFCLSKDGNLRIAPALLAAGGRMMQELNVRNLIGVFDKKMERVYRALGASPFVIGEQESEYDSVCVGIWQHNEELYSELLRKAGILPAEMELYFANSSFTAQKSLAIA